MKRHPKAGRARSALLRLEDAVILCGPQMLPLSFGADGTLAVTPQPRLRVTRRGNVHDDATRQTVVATHGMGSIRERIAWAEHYVAEVAAGCPPPQPPCDGNRREDAPDPAR